MSNQARISAAIEKLERFKLNATLDKWVVVTSGIDNVRGVIVVYDPNRLRRVNANLIVTLHRTIDAQLSLLRLALEYGDLEAGNGSRFVRHAQELANSILGSES